MTPLLTAIGAGRVKSMSTKVMNERGMQERRRRDEDGAEEQELPTSQATVPGKGACVVHVGEACEDEVRTLTHSLVLEFFVVCLMSWQKISSRISLLS